MGSLVERRPVAFTLGFGAAMIAVTVVSRVALEALFPSLTLHGIGLILNWVFVALVVGLVAWLGWWEKIRLTAPVNRRALIYLLPFAAMVFVPVAFGFAIPDVSLVEGTTLPAWAALFVVVRRRTRRSRLGGTPLPRRVAPGTRTTWSRSGRRSTGRRVRPLARLTGHPRQLPRRVAPPDDPDHPVGNRPRGRRLPTGEPLATRPLAFLGRRYGSLGRESLAPDGSRGHWPDIRRLRGRRESPLAGSTTRGAANACADRNSRVKYEISFEHSGTVRRRIPGASSSRDGCICPLHRLFLPND